MAEQLKDKMFLAVFDKLILGVVVVVVGLWAQSTWKEKEKVRDAQLAVSRIHTDILTEQRKILVSGMGTYFQLLNECELLGFAEDDLVRRLKTSTESTETAIYQITGLFPDFKDRSAGLERLIAKANVNLFTRRRQPSEIREESDRIRAEYAVVLESLRDLSVAAVEADWRAVAQRMERGRQYRAAEQNERDVEAVPRQSPARGSLARGGPEGQGIEVQRGRGTGNVQTNPEDSVGPESAITLE